MIEIKVYNEQRDKDGVRSFDTEMYIDGEGSLIVRQLISIFDKIYEVEPGLFEIVLLNCQYTEDHT